MIHFRTFVLFTLALIPAFALAQYEFTPLTNLPGLNTVANSDTLPTFLSNLYRLCIGAAAVIAILQIMRAGVQYFMFNKGSVAHNEKGKALIGNALLGLLLVLSPAIVFGIINPDILNLNLDVSELKLPDRTYNLTQTGVQVENTIDAAIQACDISITTEQRSCVSSRVTTIFGTAASCIAQGNANACLTTARQSARTAARTCVPAITNAQEFCLEDRLTNAFISGNTQSAGGCQTFLSGQTDVVTQAAQQCCSVQSGCQLKQETGRTYCQCGTLANHTPSIEYIYEGQLLESSGRCAEEGRDTYTTVAACNAAAAAFPPSGRRGAMRNNCSAPGSDYSPSATYYDLSNLPACD